MIDRRYLYSYYYGYYLVFAFTHYPDDSDVQRKAMVTHWWLRFEQVNEALHDWALRCTCKSESCSLGSAFLISMDNASANHITVGGANVSVHVITLRDRYMLYETTETVPVGFTRKPFNLRTNKFQNETSLYAQSVWK